MLDLNFVRDNLALVEEKLRQRGMNPTEVLKDFRAIDGAKVFQNFCWVHSTLPQLFFHQRQVVTNKIQIEHCALTLAEKYGSVHADDITCVRTPAPCCPAGRSSAPPLRARIRNE